MGVTAHLNYLGYNVSGQCTRKEPGLLGDGIFFAHANDFVESEIASTQVEASTFLNE